jgi:hypothetical protein
MRPTRVVEESGRQRARAGQWCLPEASHSCRS